MLSDDCTFRPYMFHIYRLAYPLIHGWCYCPTRRIQSPLVTDLQHSVRGLMVQHPVGGGGNYSTHRRFVSQPLRSLIGFASIGIAAIIRRETHTPTPPLTP